MDIRSMQDGSARLLIGNDVEVQHSVRSDTLQGVLDTDQSFNPPNNAIDISSAFYRVPLASQIDDESGNTTNNNIDDRDEYLNNNLNSEPAPLSLVTRNDDGVIEPDLTNEKLKNKHRKHTRYRYSNQPSRFRNSDENVMNYLHLRIGHASDMTIKRMVREKYG
jgi:hypothetical protein